MTNADKNTKEIIHLTIQKCMSILEKEENNDLELLSSEFTKNYLEIDKVSLAGFDGFKNKYNESYADEYLPSLNNDGKWDELNAEIKEMYSDFKQKSKHLKSINFITESIYNI